MKKLTNAHWKLVAYDLIVFVAVDLLLLMFSDELLFTQGMTAQITLGLTVIFAAHLLSGVYNQIWQYGGIQCYIKLALTDC